MVAVQEPTWTLWHYVELYIIVSIEWDTIDLWKGMM